MGADTAYICVLCDAACIGWGNNPDPVNGLTYNDGRCCDDCNATRVIPARVQLIADAMIAARSPEDQARAEANAAREGSR